MHSNLNLNKESCVPCEWRNSPCGMWINQEWAISKLFQCMNARFEIVSYLIWIIEKRRRFLEKHCTRFWLLCGIHKFENCVSRFSGYRLFPLNDSCINSTSLFERVTYIGRIFIVCTVHSRWKKHNNHKFIRMRSFSAIGIPRNIHCAYDMKSYREYLRLWIWFFLRENFFMSSFIKWNFISILHYFLVIYYSYYKYQISHNHQYVYCIWRLNLD